tara:strand:- start:8701 stop:8958 length:258 start_codon:yes stop_codon:yes gene_type:complete
MSKISEIAGLLISARDMDPGFSQNEVFNQYRSDYGIIFTKEDRERALSAADSIWSGYQAEAGVPSHKRISKAERQEITVMIERAD